MAKYALIGTPKALDRFLKELDKLPEEYRNDYELAPTPWVYMNMSDGWTKEECDEVVYIMETQCLKT